MLLRIFTQNNRGLLFAFPILIILMSILLWSLGQAHTPLSRIYASQYILESSSFNGWTLSIGVIGICSISLLLNASFNNSELYFQPSYLIGFLASVTFVVAFFKLHSFSWLLSQICLAAALFFSIQIQNQKRIFSALFLSQLFLGTAICIFPQNIGFVMANPLILILNRNFSLKELVFALFSISAPLLYWMSYCLFSDQLHHWYFWAKTSMSFDTSALFSSILFWTGSFVISAALFGIFTKENRQTNKTQQAKNVLVIFFTSSLLSGLFCSLIQEPFTIYNCTLPFILLAGYYWTHYRVSLIAPFIFYSWFICLLLFAFDIIH